MAAPYKYTALAPEGEIRLLQIDRRPSQQLIYSLEIFRFDNVPPYHALSYTWSDPLDRRLSSPESQRVMSGLLSKQITHKGGTTLAVTENLFDALEHLGEDQNHSYWWIDAICINQKDNGEKSKQVGLMGNIYQRAMRVVIWPVSDEAIEDLVTNHSFSSDGFAAGDGLITAAQVLGINDVDYQAWLDYGAFLQRKWFTRIWVVQEKYFADEPDALIGKHRMAWSIILKASQVMIRSNMDTLLKAYVDFCMDDDDYNVDRAAMELTDNRLDNQRIFSSLQRTSLRNWTLEGLLYCTRSFDATESRDRVFALKDIWMAQRQHALQHIEIEIDYNKPLSQIYYEATLIAVVESQSLGIIGLTEDSLARNGKDLASWVPNYSAKATMNLLSGHPEQTGMPDRWQASLGLKFIDPKMESEHHLQVLGLEHDSIAETGPGYIDIMNRFSIESLLEFLENYPDDKYPTNEVPCDAFLKTLIKNTFRDRCVGSEACEAFPAFLMQRILELGEQLEESKYRNQAQDTKKLSRQFQSAKDIVTILSSNARGERTVFCNFAALAQPDSRHAVPTHFLPQNNKQTMQEFNNGTTSSNGASDSESRLLYFAYGSNLSSTQMLSRCPKSQPIGLAYLPGWNWLINERGYANIVDARPMKETSVSSAVGSPGVYGVLYRLHLDDEETLDRCEGVPWAYERYDVSVIYVEGDSFPKGQSIKVLAYVDFKRLSPAAPREEYIARMNRGIDEAVRKWALPQTYADEVMRPFLPVKVAKPNGAV
ncbi:heterokaryon incompatibility protein-domain-containing protein [Xylariaceae sp. FL0016]|nr:heterokaryon incompatibility protein-domain-containing protein [Xylariaceae sp. FL0016]